jgi:hypothetical protein
MKGSTLIAFAMMVYATNAFAAEATCKSQADDKKLAGGCTDQLHEEQPRPALPRSASVTRSAPERNSLNLICPANTVVSCSRGPAGSHVARLLARDGRSPARGYARKTACIIRCVCGKWRSRCCRMRSARTARAWRRAYECLAGFRNTPAGPLSGRLLLLAILFKRVFDILETARSLVQES